jgi:hypothetical protein
MGIFKVSALKKSLVQIRGIEIRLAEATATQFHLIQVCICEVGLIESGVREIRPSNVRITEPSAPQVRST